MQTHVEYMTADERRTQNEHGNWGCESGESYTDYDGTLAHAECRLDAECWFVYDGWFEEEDAAEPMAVAMCRRHANLAVLDARSLA